jgi:hypothetical protein
MADLTGVTPKKTLDGQNFAVESVEGIAEAGIIGTIADVVLTALSTLPVVVVSAGNALPVSVAFAGVIAIVQIGRAFKRNYQ